LIIPVGLCHCGTLVAGEHFDEFELGIHFATDCFRHPSKPNLELFAFSLSTIPGQSLLTTYLHHSAQAFNPLYQSNQLSLSICWPKAFQLHQLSLGRSARDLLDTVHQLDKMGVTLHIVDMGGDNLSTQGPAGKLMFVILAGMAEFERELIRGRIQDALDRRFDQRRIIGTVPYGYDLDDGNLVDNPGEQSIIRRIAQQRAAGCSYKQIADQLNPDGIPTKTGKGKWQCGNVAGVLNSKHTARFLDEPEAEL
jgi:hypothetical protein